MPRSAKVVLGSLAALLLLAHGEHIPGEFPMKGFIEHAIPHLLIVAISVVVGGVLVWIIEESLRDHITPAIRAGLGTFSTQIATEVKEQLNQIPAAIKKWSEVMEELRNENLTTPGVKQLVAEGKIEEAAAKASKAEEEATVLLSSEHSADWDRAVALLENVPTAKPKLFLTLAYRFWEAGKIDRAIQVAERGLKAAGRSQDGEYGFKLKCSLAYYYAETQRPDYEQSARVYAEEALNNDPESASKMDTLGFVKICYGKTPDEILEGVTICDKARRLGVPFKYYAKNVSIAEKRMAEIEGMKSGQKVPG